MKAALISYMSEVVTTGVIIDVAEDYQFDVSPYEQDGKCPADGSNQVIERIGHRFVLVHKQSGEVCDQTEVDEQDEELAGEVFDMENPSWEEDYRIEYRGCYSEDSGTLVE